MILERSDIDRLATVNGAVLHIPRPGNRNGCERWRPNGRLQTWKRDPDRFRLPIKHGLRDYDALTDGDNRVPDGSVIVTREDPCPHCGLTY